MTTNKKCGYCKEYGHYKTTCPEIDTNKECPICYRNISKIKNNIITPCGHSFCFKCFMKWNEENESCPYCRKRIAKKQTRIEYIEIENVVEQEIIVEQEIVVYPSLKDYCYHLFSETIQLCIKNKDNIILLYLFIVYFVISYIKLKNDKNKIDYELKT